MTKKTNNENNSFNLEKALDEYVCPAMFKAGLKHYIKTNKITPKNEKEFQKIIDDFGKIKMGE